MLHPRSFGAGCTRVRLSALLAALGPASKASASVVLVPEHGRMTQSHKAEATEPKAPAPERARKRVAKQEPA